MKKLFVSYEIAKLLKEKGFNESCIAYYETKVTLNFLDTHFGAIIPTNKDGFGVDAPLFQQVIDWFREKHNIRIVDSLHTNTMTSMDLNKHFHFNAIKIQGGEDGGGSGTKDLKFGNGNSEYQHYTDYYQALELTIHELLSKKI